MSRTTENSFIVGDAGGTSTHWRLVKESQITQFKTIGFNAYTHKIEDLIKDIQTEVGSELNEVSTIYLYAAGVDMPSQKKDVEEKLSTICDAIPHVENDLLGVSRALCGTKQGNVCIMGTGSNACYYDGERVDKVSASLGYILGDEGSGAHLGKHFLAKSFRNQIDDKIIRIFQDKYGFSSHQVIEILYNQDKPNHFLASFAKFIADHKNHPDIYQIIYGSFTDFFNAFFPQGSQNGSFYFSGSIAFYFSDILRQVAVDMGFHIQNIIESPIAGIVLYHKSHD